MVSRIGNKNRVPKTRVIYDNYNLWEKYPDDDLREMVIENGWVDEDDEITDDMLLSWRYNEDEADWDCEWERLTEFFSGKTVGFFGEVGRWDGVYKAGQIGEFRKLFEKAITDCQYIRLYDENGHMYLTCSHHDGTCHFEIREITPDGEEYMERWEYAWDNRSEQYVHNQVYKRYSRMPRFAQKVYGCPAREYEKVTKGKLTDMLNNEAKSFYSVVA